jgi:2,3-bisphosphoglycerate-dependent phosphoglycerate mutase
MSYLVLIRHGDSCWNEKNKFTGWVDVPLSCEGVMHSLAAGKQLRKINFDVAFTSKLERAQETLLLILSEQNYTGIFQHEEGLGKRWSNHLAEKGEIPIYSNEALNERYYGQLQGMSKDKARKIYGEDKVFIWRRSWDVHPPGGESLKDTYQRAVPYFRMRVMPFILQGKNVLVSAHGNSLRAIIKYIESISDEDIPHLEIPTGKPLIYRLRAGKIMLENHRHTFTRPVKWK